MEADSPVAPARHRLVGRVELCTGGDAWLCDSRVRLLEAIAVHCSIVRAARQVPVSYKTAWDAVDDMNKSAPLPLVVRSKGGRAGGGTRLTQHGRHAIAIFRMVEAECQSAIDKLSGQFGMDGEA